MFCHAAVFLSESNIRRRYVVKIAHFRAGLESISQELGLRWQIGPAGIYKETMPLLTYTNLC